MKELYLVRSPYVFMGVNGDPDKTRFSIVGIPFDSTNSFRGGARFGPLHVRISSQSLEAYSLRAGVSIDDNPPVDEGDIFVVHGSAEATLRNISAVAEEFIRLGRTPIFIGGDHTVTFGVIEGILRALGTKPCVLIFDAHLDYRREYLGYRWSHACVARRISEVIGTERMLSIGVRAFDKTELRDAKTTGYRYLTILDIKRSTIRDTISKIREHISDCDKIYLSIDIDVVDPGFAPGVATPEPEGLTPTELLDMLWRIIDGRFIGFDVVEIDPTSDRSNITSFLAAKIIMEIVAYMTVKEG